MITLLNIKNFIDDERQIPFSQIHS